MLSSDGIRKAISQLRSTIQLWEPNLFECNEELVLRFMPSDVFPASAFNSYMNFQPEVDIDILYQLGRCLNAR